MVYLQTKNPNLGKFRRALTWKMLVYLIAIWNYFKAILYIFTQFWYIVPRKTLIKRSIVGSIPAMVLAYVENTPVLLVKNLIGVAFKKLLFIQ
jgi:hypothetical protein